MLRPVPATVLVLLAISTSGCALAGRNSPASLENEGFSDRYSLSLANGSEAAAPDPGAWWPRFGDPLLTDIVSRARQPRARAEAAKAYVRVRAEQARLANLQEFLAAKQRTREIAGFRAEARLTTQLDVLRIEAEALRASARIPRMQAAIDIDAARIAVLDDHAPGALRERLAAPGPIPTGPAATAVGRPHDLLERRADLRQAASRLRAVAWLPGGSRAALEDYQQAARRAEEEVEAAMAALRGAGARVDVASKTAEQAERAAGLARRQYQEGLAGYESLSGVEAMLLESRDALADAQADRAGALIDLYIALGDGSSDSSRGK